MHSSFSHNASSSFTHHHIGRAPPPIKVCLRGAGQCFEGEADDLLCAMTTARAISHHQSVSQPASHHLVTLAQSRQRYNTTSSTPQQPDTLRREIFNSAGGSRLGGGGAEAAVPPSSSSLCADETTIYAFVHIISPLRGRHHRRRQESRMCRREQRLGAALAPQSSAPTPALRRASPMRRFGVKQRSALVRAGGSIQRGETKRRRINPSGAEFINTDTGWEKQREN